MKKNFFGAEYTGKKATAIGWGKKSENGNISQQLLEVNLTVISNEDCKKDDAVGSYIVPSMICTREDEKDACQGDSGGPLMISRVNKAGKTFWEQVGLVSFGVGCARPDLAAVFTRISSFVDWIHKNTKGITYCRRPE